MDPRSAQVAVVAALAEPTRRRPYDHVVRQPEPVGRYEVAAAPGISRSRREVRPAGLADPDTPLELLAGQDPGPSGVPGCRRSRAGGRLEPTSHPGNDWT